MSKKMIHQNTFLEGMRDGVPIGLGYLAVSFSLGIAAKQSGLNAFQGFLVSALNSASAGEYAGFTVIAAMAGYIEVAIITLIANARYMLMSCAMSQRFDPKMPLIHRFTMAFYITDELFAIAISRPGYINPIYYYGAVSIAAPCWAFGTAFGVIAGNLLPLRVVSALSVALFGMFLAVIIPPAKRNRIILGLVLISFAASYAFSRLPVVSQWSGGTRTIVLTLVISTAAALLFPVKNAREHTPREELEADGKLSEIEENQVVMKDKLNKEQEDN